MIAVTSRGKSQLGMGPQMPVSQINRGWYTNWAELRYVLELILTVCGLDMGVEGIQEVGMFRDNTKFYLRISQCRA